MTPVTDIILYDRNLSELVDLLPFTRQTREISHRRTLRLR